MKLYIVKCHNHLIYLDMGTDPYEILRVTLSSDFIAAIEGSPQVKNYTFSRRQHWLQYRDKGVAFKGQYLVVGLPAAAREGPRSLSPLSCLLQRALLHWRPRPLKQ